MKRHLSPTILPFFTIVIFILVHIPTSSYADNQQYTKCRKSYKCGEIDITYPFWGAENRPEYCGYPGFEVTCKYVVLSTYWSEYCAYPEFKVACQSYVLTINISTISYRVLKISSQTLTVVRQDYWGTYCPTSTYSYVNSTLDFNIFDYGSTSQNLSLYYGCFSTTAFAITNQYTCDINDGTPSGYYLTRELNASEFALASSLGSCHNLVKVLVSESAITTLNNNLSVANLIAAINGGFELDWFANNDLCNGCNGSGGQCGHDLTSGAFTCYCTNTSASTCVSNNSPGSGSSGSLPSSDLGPKLAIGFSAAGAGIIFIIVMICCRRKVCVLGMASTLRTNEQDVDTFIRNCGSLAPKQYKYSDVKKLTNSFTEKLGQGGYGCVYKGKLSDARLVAVKVLSESKGNGEEFLNEVASISRTSHVNVVNLLGFCYERTKRALIYEYMPNGSLDKFIYIERSSNTNCHLEWGTLYRIAVGIARGLEYLHSGCNTRILHFDIKPHNILLDEDFQPKISDFGLAKLCQRKESVISMLGARGTIGYIAPEVFSRHFGGVSYKSDVYSYGMMMLEMAGGGKKIEASVSQTSEIYFPHWIYKQLEPGMELKLDGVMTANEKELARKMILVGLWCIQTIPSDRPSMTKVVEMLEGSIQSLQIPPKPFLSSPPRSPQHYSSTISTLS